MLKERIRETRLTQKGQVTIPIEIRKRLGLNPRDRVRFEVDGLAVRILPAESRMARHFGSVATPPEVEGLSPKQLREAYEEAVAQETVPKGQ